MERHARSRSSAISACRAARSRSTCSSSRWKRAFQLMEIRAALGPHFVGFNTGRWDYINSVSDAAAWDPAVVNPEHRRHHDDLRLHARLRGSRAPRGQHAGSPRSLRALAGRDGAQHPGRLGRRRRRRAWRARWPAPSANSARARAANGSRTGRWCTSSGPSGRRSGSANQLGRAFPPLTYTAADADGLFLLEPAPRTIRGARDLISVALQYGNAFGRGLPGRRAQAGGLLRQ